MGTKTTYAPGSRPVTKKTMWIFAIGQMGWEVFAGIIGNWLVAYFQPNTSDGLPSFIQQGTVFWVLTVIGVITAIGRIFDAITDPLVANWSDNLKSKHGRRIPFMFFASIPLALVTVLIFALHVPETVANAQVWNAVLLAVLLLAFYFILTCYCTPYNALMAELSKTPEDRMYISTAISLTFIVGNLFAFAPSAVVGILRKGGLSSVASYNIVFSVLAAIGLVCCLLPCLLIKEPDYVAPVTVEKKSNVFKSLNATFKNKDFLVFVTSDICYFVGLTMFQTGLQKYVVTLFGLEEGWTTYLLGIMTLISVALYFAVTPLTKKFGKKKLLVTAFIWFAVVFLLASLGVRATLHYFTTATGSKVSEMANVGLLKIPGVVLGLAVAVLAAVPMAILGILPQSIVADIAAEDTIKTGEKREGMFYAARTFAFKMGQSIAMILFSTFAMIGATTGYAAQATEKVLDDGSKVTEWTNTGIEGSVVNGTGYRIALIVAAAFVLLGAFAILFYNEKRVNQTIASAAKLEAKEAERVEPVFKSKKDSESK